MAKELPYYRFTVSEWLNDDISIESYEMKGVFIDICAWYWFKDCSIDLATLKKRFKDAAELIDQLIESGIIKVLSDQSIEIKFLNEQFDLLSEKRNNHVNAGRAGGLKRSSNAKATLKQRSSYKDKDKDNNKDKDKDKSVVPPSLSEVKTFFKANEYESAGAEKAYHWYNDRNWINSKGKPVISWKNTMRNNWFKPEYKLGVLWSKETAL